MKFFGRITGLLTLVAFQCVFAADLVVDTRSARSSKFLSVPIAGECEQLFLLHQVALHETSSASAVLSDYLQEKGSSYGQYIAQKMNGADTDRLLKSLLRSDAGLSAWIPAAAAEHASAVVFREDGIWRGLEFESIGNLIRFVAAGGASIYENYGLDTLTVRVRDEYTAERMKSFEVALQTILEVARIRHLRLANDQYSHRDYQLNRWVRRPNNTVMSFEQFPTSKKMIENLETLVIEDIDFSAEALAMIGKFTRLWYFGSQRVSFADFDFRRWGALSNITEFQIIDGNLTNEQVQALVQGRWSLLKLDIARNFDVTGDALKSLVELDLLRHLELTFTSVRLEDTAKLAPLRRLERLGILGDQWFGALRVMWLKRKLEMPDLQVY